MFPALISIREDRLQDYFGSWNCFFFIFHFGQKIRKGLNKHAAEPHRCPAADGSSHNFWYSTVGAPAERKTFQMIWYYLNLIATENMCRFEIRHDMFAWAARNNAQLYSARSDRYRSSVIVYSADGCQGGIITITAKMACRAHLIMPQMLRALNFSGRHATVNGA